MRPVVGYEGIFSITESGDVYSHRTNRFLVQGTLHNGYKCISSKIGGRNGRCICLRVHRMVADAYIENPENKPFVNHIDGCKTNNHVSNLEWCTAKENSRHAYIIGLYDTDAVRNAARAQRFLSDEDLDRIREIYIPHDRIFGARSISRQLGICHTAITRHL